MVFRTSGKKAKNPILIKNSTIVPCKCDNFVPIVVLGVSIEVHLTRSAEYSADYTKILTLDDQETTTASRNRYQDLTEWLEEFTEMLVEPGSTCSGSDSKDPPAPPGPEPLSIKDTKGEAQIVHTLSQRPKL